MALVEQLGDDSWKVVQRVICIFFKLFLTIPFFVFFFNMVSIDRIVNDTSTS